MPWPQRSERLVQQEWVINVGGTEATIFRWLDAGGPVDLTEYGLSLAVEWPAYKAWPAGAFDLACGLEADGFWKLNQQERTQKGMFAIRLPQPQRDLLPRSWPADYAIWVERWGQRTKRWAGRINATEGPGTGG